MPFRTSHCLNTEIVFFAYIINLFSFFLFGMSQRNLTSQVVKGGSVVGSQVSLGFSGEPGVYPMHSREKMSANSFLFKRHVYSHAEKVGLSRMFSFEAFEAVQQHAARLCSCFFAGGADTDGNNDTRGDAGERFVVSSSFSITSDASSSADEDDSKDKHRA